MLAGSALADGIAREYTLNEICIITRAAPARLLGLRVAGTDLTSADLMVGTSAGAVTATKLGSDAALEASSQASMTRMTVASAHTCSSSSWPRSGRCICAGRARSG